MSSVDVAVATLIGFASDLRNEGISIGTGQVIDFCRGAAVVSETDDRDALYWTGRSTLINRADDVDLYDKTYRRWFGAADEEAFQPERGRQTSILARFERDQERLSVEESETEGADKFFGTAASSIEVLRRKSFELLSEEEREEVERLISELRPSAPLRTGRRARPHHTGNLLDLRRTLRSSLRFHGEVTRHKWLKRRQEPRRLVLLLDVSGSMAAYSRSMLQFAHAAARNNTKVEVFCFGTRLTRITQSVRHRHPEHALEKAVRNAVDWEGGTRIGECIAMFLRTYGRHVLSRGALVVICSDGLERGDPDFLGRQMARLRRLAHRIVWVNPLKGDPQYLPLARGMHAALPHIDTFIPGHNLASLESLAGVLEGRTPGPWSSARPSGGVRGVRANSPT